MQNATKLRIGAGGANARHRCSYLCGLRQSILHSLDYELLFYQSTLGDRIEYELTFNDYSHVVWATGDANYKIENISLEFDKVNEPELGRLTRAQDAKPLAILYNRILCHRNIIREKRILY